MGVSGQFHYPGHFTPKERAPSTHWIGGWVDPRAGLDTVVKRKILSPCRDSNPRSSSLQLSAIPPNCDHINHHITSLPPAFSNKAVGHINNELATLRSKYRGIKFTDTFQDYVDIHVTVNWIEIEFCGQ
jgi:hypothetical protein